MLLVRNLYSNILKEQLTSYGVNYVIMVTVDWHRVACIAYFVASNYIFFVENFSQ